MSLLVIASSQWKTRALSRGTNMRIATSPGWDCHGLPIENKALQDLKVSTVLSASIPTSYHISLFWHQEDPHTLPASTIRAATKKTAEREMEI